MEDQIDMMMPAANRHPVDVLSFLFPKNRNLNILWIIIELRKMHGFSMEVQECLYKHYIIQKNKGWYHTEVDTEWLKTLNIEIKNYSFYFQKTISYNRT